MHVLTVYCIYYYYRNINTIQGMTQQTLIALTTNIESKEWIRRRHVGGVPAEHPRASTTDDVECFLVPFETQLEIISHANLL